MEHADVDALCRLYDDTKMLGWDFSRLEGRLTADRPWWDFDRDCLAAMELARWMVDLGTGGGERLTDLLARLSATERTVVATEGWDSNVPVAQDRLAPHGVDVLRYDAEQRDRMPFEDGTLDLVMSRHEAIDAVEIARVLNSGGRFLTQQVDGRDAGEIHEWFDEPYLYPKITSECFINDLQAAGMHIDVVDDWQGTMTFTDVRALVTYLALVPWDAPNFSVGDYADRLAELDGQRPIHVTQRRFRVYATKL